MQQKNSQNLLQIQDLQIELKKAWANTPTEMKSRLMPMILAAHQNLLNISRGIATPNKEKIPYEFGMVYSLLEKDPDGLIKTYAQCNTGYPCPYPPSVGSDGSCWWTGVMFDFTDVLWAYALLAYLQTQNNKFPFNTNGQTIQIGDNTTLAILGDWGAGNNAAIEVSNQVVNSAPPNQSYYIHLGDVYYAGTNQDISKLLLPFESFNFLKHWPGVSGRSFALNSNHDMYASGSGYFGNTLASPIFSAQSSASYFSLQNNNFVIVGLDTAYYSEDTWYMSGSLTDQDQKDFLSNNLRDAAQMNATVILLTHHNGLSLDGQHQEDLWAQVASVIKNYSINNLNIYWYWGHEHAAAVYKPQTMNGNNIFPRVCGHGSIPWGVATDLSTNNPGSQVQWAETATNGPGQNYFVTNGYATLKLNGASIVETFYDQQGNVSWSSQNSA